MITLTRRVNESLLINDNIRVTVIHTRDQRVRLQIDAPDDVSIRREKQDEVAAVAWRAVD
jgi:carbon storage regulator